MADALCGPSNALQNFKQHSNVDRTLQQDRLVSRSSPSQGFRSSPGPTAGLLDPEFEAFQAGHISSPPPQFDTRPQHPHFAPQQNVSRFLPQQPALPDWANDFQKMHIAHQAPAVRAPVAQHSPQASSATSWHMDFMKAQQPSVPMSGFQYNAPQPMYQPFNGMAWQHSQPQTQQFKSISEGKGKQAAQQDQWNAEAFAAAFEAASLDAVDHDDLSRVDDGLSMEKLEQEIAREIERESEATQFFVSSTQEAEDGLSQAKLEEEIAREIEMESEEIQFLIQRKAEEMEAQEQQWRMETNHLSDLGMLDVDQEFAQAEDVLQREREMGLLQEEHQGEQYYMDDPHPFMDRDMMRDPVHDQPMQEEQKSQASTPRSIDEDLARTAGHLLESVSHDTSEKFQSSVFLQLMRRLRDKEVTVEGENFVETGDFGLAAPTLSAQPRIIPAHEQDSDLGRFGGEEEPDVIVPPPRSQTPEFDPPAPPFEDWRNRLWSGMPGPAMAVAT